MKIGKISLILGTIAMAATCYAQKVSVDNENVRIPYRTLAKQPIEESERTFTVIPNFSKKSENIMRMADLRVEGLTYVNTDVAGMVIKVNFSGIIEKEIDIETISTKVKEKDGTEKVVNTFRPFINYSYDLDYGIYDRNGNLKDQETVHQSNPHIYAGKIETYKTKEFKTRGEAEKYIKMNRPIIINNLESDVITEFLKKTKHLLEYRYGYPADTEKARVQYLDNKKHPEFEEHKQLCSNIIKGLKLLNANGGVDEAKIELNASEEYLKQIPERYSDSKDKNHIKMRFIAYYDLALIYAHTDRFGQAKDMISKAIDNDYETRDCKKLKEWIEEQETMLQNNKMTSLHFTLPDEEDIDEDHPAKWILAIKEEEARIAQMAREAELNADEYLGEIAVEPYSPTRIKVTINVANSQVRERANTVHIIIDERSFDFTKPDYLRQIAVKYDKYNKCELENLTISPDGSLITAIISNLKVGEWYSVMACTNWNGIVKYTQDRSCSTLEIDKDEWVDLGLSVKWASRNIGAKKASKLGNLYSWYNTNPFEEKASVPHDMAYDKLPQSIAGDPQHDAATAHYGDGAQTPSLAQWKELFMNCEVRRIKFNRVGGYLFESPRTHQGVFIPFTDFVSDCEPRGSNNCGFYWTSEKTTDKPEKEDEVMDYIRCYNFGEVMKKEGNIRYFGKLHIRAVKSIK